MITMPASKSLTALISMFASVLLILVGGAWWVKQATMTSTLPTAEVVTQEDTETEYETVTLRLNPSTEAGTYSASIEGLTQAINGVAFQIEDPIGGAELTGSSFSIDENLEQNGWSSAINSTADSETGKTLSFSILKTQPSEESTETVSTVQLGTLSFSNVESGIDGISIVSSESFVTYASGQAARIELVVE